MNINDINFDELLPDGKPRYRRLESGAIRDESINKIVAREITSEEGREMANTRWDKWRNANASAVLKEAQAIDPSIKTKEEALALAVGKTFVAIVDSEKPRGDDLEKLAKLLGATPTIADVKQPEPKNEQDDPLYNAMLGLLAAIQEKIPHTVEGEIVTPELEDKT